MAHVDEVLLGEDAVTSGKGTPVRTLSHEERLGAGSPQLVVEDITLRLRNVGEGNRPRHCQWHTTHNLLASEKAFLAGPIIDSGDHTKVCPFVVDCNHLFVVEDELLSFLAAQFFYRLDEAVDQGDGTAIDEVAGLMLETSQELFQDADVVGASMLCKDFVHTVLVTRDAFSVLQESINQLSRLSRGDVFLQELGHNFLVK